MRKLLGVIMILCLAMLVFASPQGEESQSVPGDEGFVNGRFTTTRHITVEIYDRSNPGGSKPEDNYFTDFIKKGMLEEYNVDVTFVPVPRWTEVQVLNNLLAANEAPDVCVTYSYPTIQTYANMGGVTDMAPYLEKYKKYLPDLWELLGDRNIYWDRDPKSGTLWAIEALKFHNTRTVAFVREDWLKKLNIPEPKTLEEFEAMLKAFKANAKLLLGDDADKMIPFSLGVDVGWRASVLSTMFVPDNVSDEELWIRGFDDRQLLWPGYKEGIRVLNKWYNEGLIWKDFMLYPDGDPTEANLMKAGYVGAFIHNWDMPYRGGEDSIHANLQKIAGPDAVYIAVDPFKNASGKYRKYLSPPVDRKVFFPSSNDEPLASLLYLNWISRFENRKYLQIGDEGVHHEVLADGSIRALPVTGDKIMNSPQNIDYTITINGLDLGDTDLTIKSLALSYAGVDKRFLEKAYKVNFHDARVAKAFNVGEIKSEEGMGPALADKRTTLLVQSIVASVSDFDKVFDAGFQDYLNSGGQAIIDERKAKLEEALGKEIKLTK